MIPLALPNDCDTSTLRYNSYHGAKLATKGLQLCNDDDAGRITIRACILYVEVLEHRVNAQIDCTVT